MGWLALCPTVRAIVAVGKTVERALATTGTPLPVFASAHPSGNVRAAFPDR